MAAKNSEMKKVSTLIFFLFLTIFAFQGCVHLSTYEEKYDVDLDTLLANKMRLSELNSTAFKIAGEDCYIWIRPKFTGTRFLFFLKSRDTGTYDIYVGFKRDSLLTNKIFIHRATVLMSSNKIIELISSNETPIAVPPPIEYSPFWHDYHFNQKLIASVQSDPKLKFILEIQSKGKISDKREAVEIPIKSIIFKTNVIVKCPPNISV